MNLKKIYQKINYLLIKRHYYGVTASSRVLPDFLIIGGVRCGTTSLYYNICQHPSVLPAAYDEIGFFDDNFHLGLNWYRSMFPTKNTMNKVRKQTGKAVTGEDTPFYIWNRDALKRIKELLPEIKLIVILRNPVNRTYSNYHLSCRDNIENRSFSQAVEDDIELINKKKEKGETLSNLDFKKTYIGKSLYFEQLEQWFKIFDAKQIHVIFTEDLRDNPENTMKSVYDFLGLDDFSLETYEKQKMFEYDNMDEEIREKLTTYFKSHNEQLSKLIKSRCW